MHNNLYGYGMGCAIMGKTSDLRDVRHNGRIFLECAYCQHNDK